MSTPLVKTGQPSINLYYYNSWVSALYCYDIRTHYGGAAQLEVGYVALPHVECFLAVGIELQPGGNPGGTVFSTQCENSAEAVPSTPPVHA